MTDAAGLVLPVAATPSGRIKVTEVEARKSECVSMVISPSIDRRSSVICRKEEVDAVSIPESICGSIMPHSEFSRSINQLSNFNCQDTPEVFKLASRNLPPLSIPSLEGKQMHQRSGKFASSSGGYSKRSRIGQMEDLSMSEAEANDKKEKSQMAKPRNGLNGRRGDKRNGKLPMKSKYDYFSMKAGMLCFSSGRGGMISVEAYDVTKHLNELTVKELLDGHYKSRNIAKHKRGKAANSNDNILNSVRNGCSILQRQKASKIQDSAESDNSYNWNVSATPLCTDFSRNDNEMQGTCFSDASSQHKVTPKVLDSLLCHPKDILERVGLASVDLDALLVDAFRPAICLKDNLDSRGRQLYNRPSLVHNDAMKPSTARSTCHNKWVKIENTAALFEDRTGFLAELECLGYDPKLVPVRSNKALLSPNHAAPCTSVSFPSTDNWASSSAKCSIDSQLPSEFDANLKCKEDDSSRSLVAALTLCDIANLSQKQGLHGRTIGTHKPSDKAMKASKSMPNGKFREIFAKPKLLVSSYQGMKTEGISSALKKPRLLINETGKDLSTRTKGLVNWSITRSSSQSHRDAFANGTSYNSFVMPPPSSRVFDKSSNGRQRLR